MSSVGVQSISKSFVRQQVLRSVTLDIPAGSFFFLLGPSGCGKSTLLRIIAGLERPDQGRITIDGRDCTSTPPQERGIGMVFQHYALWPHMTVEENLRFGLQARRVSRPEQQTRIQEALRLVQMEGFRARYPHELSGGQQQRVAVARALAGRPKVLLLDEPLSNLDARLRDGIRSELRELHSQLGITIIYVTHDQEDVLVLASRLALMRDGQIIQQGTPAAVFQKPACAFSASFLGDANLLRVRVSNGRELYLAGPALVRLPDAGEARADGESTLCVRPEFVRVQPTETVLGSALALRATVNSCTYRGAYQDLTLQLEGGESMRARTLANAQHALFRAGDGVFLSWDTADSSLMD